MTSLESLAAQVEAADGPSRDLDGLIAKVLGEYPCWATKQNDRQPELFTDGAVGLRAREWLCPKYTASIDAAMTLVPAGVGDEPLSVLFQRTWRGQGRAKLLDTLGGQEAEASGNTPALAIAAAALRARVRSLVGEGEA